MFFGLTERGALALNFAYRELSGTEDFQGCLAKATFTWVLHPDLDLKFAGMYSDIQASGDFRYLGNMYKGAVGTQIKVAVLTVTLPLKCAKN